VLRSHDAVGAAVSLARNDGNLRDGSFGEGEQKFRAVPDDAAKLLLRAGKEAGNILESDQRNVEGTEALISRTPARNAG
jgi:hypothetical protein